MPTDDGRLATVIHGESDSVAESSRRVGEAYAVRQTRGTRATTASPKLRGDVPVHARAQQPGRIG